MTRLARLAKGLGARVLLAVLVVAAASAAFLYRDEIGMMMAFGRLKPTMTFAEAPPSPAPRRMQDDPFSLCAPSAIPIIVRFPKS